ncbi:hypothetical protein A3A70_01395 [candidate division WWE3 bacterium RIFCSPLOWO2_01_FULL_42_11]|uniref:Ribulose-phosphate 3-epimerase n=1 Tax=candidate division WWE3 bacterium RIFCSPLOWO2_01_FULL_42_11 TaxID=1802627 RepID=A0A1F4VQP2_UNCKA|nr:MAG: hypothetical protein A3A70_01395 [candidate division WWE3 bacterium RIFCSPLOWO2_01_FULL_42_11]
MLEIFPTILTDDPEELEEKIRVLEIVGRSKKVHLDIIDGEFVENRTVSLEAVAGVETTLSLDIHLMVVEPVLWIERALACGPERIIGHIEKMEDQDAYIKKVIGTGLRAGLAVDLETPIEKIDPMVTSEVDVVFLMGVRAGFGGQEFNRIVLDKVEKLVQIRDAEGASFKILVDGGVNAENVKEIEQAGANEVAVGHDFEQVKDLYGN